MTKTGSDRSAFLAGGGVRGGQVLGASDAAGAYPKERPVSPADFLATLYHALGIAPDTVIQDREGRPHRLSEGRPLRELF
jgi:hypothetical protein